MSRFTNLYELLPELVEIEQLAEAHPDIVHLHELTHIQGRYVRYPIYGLTIGNPDPSIPAVGLFGGVHGLERIGTQVICSFLYTLKKRLSWDVDYREFFEKRRIVTIPLLNPWGVVHRSRANRNGVDLMRNAPIDAKEYATWMVGGHRISPKLPWYRGQISDPMETEAQVLVDFVQEKVFSSPVSVCVDVHSGFGTRDQIWYPYAKSTDLFTYYEQFNRLKNLFEETYPHHVYIIEPQSKVYTTHGDLWDYLLLQHEINCPDKVFIPLTLELGSWNWVKKNPLQLFSMFGLFNPIKNHRYSRTMRRHLYLFDFLLRAVRNSESWGALGDQLTREIQLKTKSKSIKSA